MILKSHPARLQRTHTTLISGLILFREEFDSDRSREWSKTECHGKSERRQDSRSIKKYKQRIVFPSCRKERKGSQWSLLARWGGGGVINFLYMCPKCPKMSNKEKNQSQNEYLCHSHFSHYFRIMWNSMIDEKHQARQKFAL